jgi:hypothetical protein
MSSLRQRDLLRLSGANNIHIINQTGSIGSSGIYNYSVTITGLTPGTQYSSR